MFNSRFDRRFVIFIAGAGFLAVSGCSNSTQTQDSSPSEAASTVAEESTSSVERNTELEVVRMLTHDSFALSDELIENLTEQGIQLEILATGDAGSMTAGAVLAAGAPTADLIFGVDNTLITRAADEGVFAPYTSPELTNIAPEFQNRTEGGFVTPVDFGDVCINVDNNWYANNDTSPPTSLEQLPDYADQLVVQDPGTSSPGLAFLLATVDRFGGSWPEYWGQLREGGVKVSGSWTDAYYTDFTLSGGDRPLVVSYATSPAAEVIFAEDESVTEPTTTSLLDSCYRQVEFAGVLAGAANPSGAQKVIDWLLSQEVQEDIPINMFVYPVRSDAQLPPVFSEFTPVVADSAELESAFISVELDQILSKWGEVMGR